MFSTVTLVLVVSCFGAALGTYKPYWNSYLPVQGAGNGGYWNSYVPQYGNYGPQKYPGYSGSYWPGAWGGWQGDNVGSQKNSVDGTGNYVGWQKNYVN
ncbi:neuropeptide-like protein 29 [Dreissena polymorpha]|uniref:neuropeptide-like protein 29 n=1 Tax=Dreissena polymorpha TaxID=45954 RepID=UPI00226559FE|nr:neuropeptide-like protein 29 [Dreissena polymorpha]